VSIVGIGASAGGLEAFKEFFSAMPANAGMAFVLIQHLDPAHESLTADLLARHTEMTVVQVEDRMPVEANFVYAIPPNTYLTISDNVLHLAAPVRRRGMRMPIDGFFQSLAEDQQEKAIGVILSGTGSDGTLGLGAVKGHGGMTMAQAPETAPFDSMPRSAIATGLVDYVSPIGEMPEIIVKYVRHPYVMDSRRPDALTGQVSDQLNAILAVLHNRTAYDFQCYKKGTLVRGVGRRMGLNHIEQVADYLGLLREDAAESTELVKDLLISVTSFFREPGAFKVLEKQVIPKLIQGRGAGAPIRAWVPGCATGEEAYSIAMLLIEQMQAAGRTHAVQVFATDIDGGALEAARAGIYPVNAVADVSPERLQRFFGKQDKSYQVHKQVRESVVFAAQNLISHPPFSKLDLISCRNLLIYLEPDVQSKVIRLFHFALNEGGHLFLGNSETIGQHGDLFAPVSKKWRVYRRLEAARHVAVDLPVIPGRGLLSGARVATQPLPSGHARLGELVQRRLLQDYAPASVLIDRECQILYFHGPTDRYLRQPTGSPTDDLIALAREPLRTKLRATVREAIRDERPATTTGAHVRRDGTQHSVTVLVNPVEVPKVAEKLLLVSFEESPGLAGPERASRVADGSSSTGSEESLVHQLELELTAAKDELQGTIGELESSNEDLKAANEEAMSMNEELQSTNEELETSKEELQSLNEELTTVNQQLQDKMEELEATHTDLSNLFSSTDIATVFLDTQGRIKRFTPAAIELLSLIATDVGRSISDISHKLRDIDLLKDAKVVLDDVTPLEREVCTNDGSWYVQRALPYRTLDDKIDGVVVTFIDITERKRAEQRMKDARAYAESVVEAVREPLLVLNQELRVISANRAFYEEFRVAPEETEDRQLYELGNHQWNIPSLKVLLEEILQANTEVDGFEVTHSFPGIGLKTMLLNARQVEQRDNLPQLILLAIEDVTQRRTAEAALFNEKERAQVTLESIGDAVISADRKSVVEYMNPVAEALTGWAAHEARGQPLAAVFHVIDETTRERLPDPLAPVLEEGRATRLTDYTVLLGRDGREYAIRYSAAPIRDRKGELLGVVMAFSDITEARRMAREMTHQASHDALTGLVNRPEFEHRLQRVLTTAAAKKAEHALCYLDLDQFKIINDTCGHVAGDELLRQLGELLQEHVRKRDTLARLGGDEFGVLMEGCSVEQAQRVANTLRRAVEGFRFVWEDKSFTIGVSIGLVPITEASGSVSAMLSAADAACYAAKDRGRNRIHVYREDDAELAQRHGEMRWVSRIQQALEEDRFHLSLQPIIPIRTRDGAGEHCELLLWMEDEEGRRVPPGAFLPAAERYNLSIKLDRWVIGTALEWLTHHPKRLKRLHLCCINLSGHSLGDEDLLAFVFDKMKERRVSPEKICFEITETAAISNLSAVTRFIKALKELGCRFALDDFGSGLSSFAYLKNLPVDFLKIDGLFVKDIINDPIDLAMVKSINEIGHVMEKETIAEWVESDSILEKLREIEVDYAQGYSIGRPQPI
jgi:two-component system CheB/CheR fusion protein